MKLFAVFIIVVQCWWYVAQGMYYFTEFIRLEDTKGKLIAAIPIVICLTISTLWLKGVLLHDMG